MSAHTPGPWFVDADGKVWRRDPRDLYENGGGVAGDHPVATVHRGWPRWEDGFPVEANARLIAAAPELLDALKKRAVVDAAYSRLALMDADDDERERLLQQIEDAEEAAFDFSRAAIAKAEGRS